MVDITKQTPNVVQFPHSSSQPVSQGFSYHQTKHTNADGEISQETNCNISPTVAVIATTAAGIIAISFAYALAKNGGGVSYGAGSININQRHRQA